MELADERIYGEHCRAIEGISVRLVAQHVFPVQRKEDESGDGVISSLFWWGRRGSGSTFCNEVCAPSKRIWAH